MLQSAQNQLKAVFCQIQTYSVNFYTLVLYFFLFLPSVVFAQDTVRTHINKDVTAIFSTHPDRPFEYGYPYTRKEILDGYKDKFEAYGIDSRMVVASVGAASGWMQGIFSVFSEHVTYYVQDIDDQVLNQEQLDAVVSHFSSQRTTPQTNSFKWVIGTETETRLPDNFFDLLIVNNTFHEFSEPEVMINDLARKIKDDGRIVICEHFSNEEWVVKHAGCRIKGYQVAEIKEMFAEHGLYLTKTRLPEFATHNYLTFEKDKLKSEKYEQEQAEISTVLTALERLLSKKVLKDWESLMQVQDVLIDELPKPYNVYPFIAEFFHDLAEHYLEQGKYNRALEVLNTMDEVILNDPYSPSIRGDVYYEAELFEEANEQYEIAIKRDPYEVYNYANLVLSSAYLWDWENGMMAYLEGLVVDSTDDYLHSALGELLVEMYENEFYEFPFVVGEPEIAYFFAPEMEAEDVLQFALEAFDKAIAIKPLDPDYYFSRSQVYLQLEAYEKAIADYNRILYLDPYRLYIYKFRAKAKKAMGDEAGYEADLEELKKVRKKKD